MPDMMLPVSFSFVSLLAVLLIPMTGWIGLYRGKVNVLRADGGDATLFKRIRIHGNLMENAAVFVIVLGAAEISGLAAAWLWAAVICFLIGRITHFILYDTKMRGGAMFLTLAPGAAMGLWLLSRIWG